MPTIHQLPPAVVNKIAAGEVIERPASVVKELLENAIDAGARRIEVQLEKGGSQLIRVADDGCGIAAEQLELAVASHATSKIRDADDLFRVATLGFRGEALASIAEISRLVLRSRESEADSGAELRVNGGERQPVAPCGCGPGTTIEVRDLFFNTPVRRKFMRSTQTELGHATEAFVRVALAHPRVRCLLRHNERVVHDLPPVESWRERVAALFGRGLAESLIWVESDDGAARIAGYVAHPDESRSNNRMQYLLLNGRFIRDRALQHALGEAYRGLLMTGRYPIAFLQLELPVDAVDVNVHPTKLEVRFADSGRVYSQLLGAIRKRFLTTDLSRRLNGEGPSAKSDNGEQSAPVTGAENDAAATAHDREHAQQLRAELESWARGQLGAGESTDSTADGDANPAGGASRQAEFELRMDRPPLELNPLPRSWPPPAAKPAAAGSHGEAPGGGENDEPDASTARPPTELANTQAVQIHNRYLVTESDDGVVVIDQHALHERILYEELREKVLAGAVETQRLLVPEPIDLTAAEAAAVLENRQLLAQLGIEVEPFGGDTVLVSAYPAMLANMNPAEMVRQVLEQFLAGGKQPDRRDLLDELLHMISCKAAIKAGDRLSSGEISALLERRHAVQDSHHCPHGRPTALVFTRQELDRRFGRT